MTGALPQNSRELAVLTSYFLLLVATKRGVSLVDDVLSAPLLQGRGPSALFFILLICIEKVITFTVRTKTIVGEFALLRS